MTHGVLTHEIFGRAAYRMAVVVLIVILYLFCSHCKRIFTFCSFLGKKTRTQGSEACHLTPMKRDGLGSR
ncbi:MAG: hypothetical protein VW472_05975, partial [Candidatus Puniceispirillum sp.]